MDIDHSTNNLTHILYHLGVEGIQGAIFLGILLLFFKIGVRRFWLKRKGSVATAANLVEGRLKRAKRRTTKFKKNR